MINKWSASRFFLALSGLAFAVAAQATPLVFTYSGTISSGIDNRGTFSNGVGDTDLSGASFTKRIVFDPAAIPVWNDPANPYPGSQVLGQQSGNVGTDTVTINGVSHTFAWDWSKVNVSQMYLANVISRGDPTAQQIDQVGVSLSGNTANYTTVTAQAWIANLGSPLNLAAGFNQNWTHAVQPGDLSGTYFQVFGPDAEASFYGTASTFSIDSPAPVPEPDGVLMLGAGLALLALVRRKH